MPIAKKESSLMRIPCFHSDQEASCHAFIWYNTADCSNCNFILNGGGRLVLCQIIINQIMAWFEGGNFSSAIRESNHWHSETFKSALCIEFPKCRKILLIKKALTFAFTTPAFSVSSTCKTFSNSQPGKEYFKMGNVLSKNLGGLYRIRNYLLFPEHKPAQTKVSSYSVSGNTIVKVLPLPTMLLTCIDPECSSEICLAIASPKPEPPVSLDRDLSTR